MASCGGGGGSSSGKASEGGVGGAVLLASLLTLRGTNRGVGTMHPVPRVGMAMVVLYVQAVQCNAMQCNTMQCNAVQVVRYVGHM